MSVNYRDAIRRSFVSKIAIYLQQGGSRDMSIPLNFNNGIADFTYQNSVTPYGIIPREIGEDLFFPGVNILFLDEADASLGRSHKKRYILGTKISIIKPIEGNTPPRLVAKEVRGISQLILQALSDGNVQIWNYEETPPAFTGALGSFHETGYRIADESLAVSGGDIRHSITLFINYADTSF